MYPKVQLRNATYPSKVSVFRVWRHGLKGVPRVLIMLQIMRSFCESDDSCCLLGPRLPFFSQFRSSSRWCTIETQKIQKRWKCGQDTSKIRATCRVQKIWRGYCTQIGSHACHAVQYLPMLICSTTNAARSMYSERLALAASAVAFKSQHHELHGAGLGPHVLLPIYENPAASPPKPIGTSSVYKSKKGRPTLARKISARALRSMRGSLSNASKKPLES